MGHMDDTIGNVQDIEKLQEELSRLKDDINHSYYRIPKQEFESITVSKITTAVTDQVNRKINLIRNWIGAIIVILSFFGIAQWSNLTEQISQETSDEIRQIGQTITNDIEDKFDSRMLAFEERSQKRLDTIDDSQARIQNTFDTRFNEMSTDIERNIKEAARAETERQLLTVRDDIRLAQISVLKTELNAITANVDNAISANPNSKQQIYKNGLEKLDPFLQKATELNDQGLMVDFLDTLFLWTFYQGAYESMDGLRLKYENDFDFKPRTWANIAIAGMYLYEETYAPTYKERAISANFESLDRLPNYGVPYIVRLVLHMIDIERQQNTELRQKEIEEARQLVAVVHSGSNPVTSYEAYDYLIRIVPDNKIGKHIDMLFENFPESMAQIQSKHDQYLASKQS